MSTLLERYLFDWPRVYIRDQDLQVLFINGTSRRYDAVKYAVKKGYLVILKRGLYYINLPQKKQSYDLHEIGQAIYGPSYVSLESALSYHGWIPEAVYSTTSVTTRRSKEFATSIGYFSYAHTPSLNFYDEVNRIESNEDVFLIAEPWKAIADYLYVYKKRWHTIQDLYHDMRIEIDILKGSRIASLKRVVKSYASQKVRTTLNKFLRDLA
jgi:predicted transcriptional regulator of viral defense system